MGVDFKEALTYVFRDNSWKLKFVVLSIIMLIPTLAIEFNQTVISIPFYIYLVGFNILLMNNLIKDVYPVLPDFSIKNIFKQGIKFYGVLFLFLFIITIIIIPQAVVMGIIAVVGKYFLASDISAFNLIIIVLSSLFTIETIILSIFLLIIIPFSQLQFSKNFSFKEALNIKRAITVFVKNWGIYLLIFLLFFIVNIPLGLFYDVSYIYDNKLTLIIALLFYVPLSVFFSFAYIHLIVQAYKQSIAKLESDNVKLESLKHSFHSFDYKAIGIMVFTSLLVLVVICSMPISENSSLGKIFTQRQTPYHYRFIHNISCQTSRYKLNNPVLFPVVKDGKYGYIDKTGKLIIKPQFAYADDFYEGLAVVNVGGKRKGSSLYNSEIIGGKYGFINTKGDFDIKPVYDLAFRFTYENIALVKTGYEYKSIDKTGKVVQNTYKNKSKGLLKTIKGGKQGFKDQNGKVIIQPVYDNVSNFSKGLAVVEKNKKMGAINTKGQLVIDIKYDYLSEFKDDLAVIVVKGKYGYINKKGEIVIQPQFKDACSFSEGYADVNVNNKVGYIDKTGKIAIKPQYDANYSFLNGIAPVEVNGKWGYIDKKGNYIWKPTN